MDSCALNLACRHSVHSMATVCQMVMWFAKQAHYDCPQCSVADASSNRPHDGAPSYCVGFGWRNCSFGPQYNKYALSDTAC